MASAALLLVAASLYCFLNPGFGLQLASLAQLAGLAGSLVVVVGLASLRWSKPGNRQAPDGAG